MMPAVLLLVSAVCLPLAVTAGGFNGGSLLGVLAAGAAIALTLRRQSEPVEPLGDRSAPHDLVSPRDARSGRHCPHQSVVGNTHPGTCWRQRAPGDCNGAGRNPVPPTKGSHHHEQDHRGPVCR